MLKTATLKERIDLTHDVIELIFETEEEFKFEAGQFITFRMSLPDGKPCLRAYSIASMPEEGGNQFRVCIKVVVDGQGSNILNKLKPGDTMQFIGPNGKFLFEEEKNKNAIFIATGTGLAPFKSMIEDQLKNKKSNKQLKVIFGVRHFSDIFYNDWLEEMSNQYENFSYEITLSRPESKDWHGHIGRVTSLVENLECNAQENEIYICGLKNMIDAVCDILKKKGIPDETINYEKYD